MDSYRESRKFQTSTGSGHFWSDDDGVRVVVQDIHGHHAFRVLGPQMDGFLAALDEARSWTNPAAATVKETKK